MAEGISRGEIRLCPFPAPDKRRPVVVLTRDAAILYLTGVTVAPITSAIRGVPSEVKLDTEDGLKGPCAVNLYNAITVSKHQLGPRIAQLRPEKMREVCSAMRFALGCNAEQ